MRSQTRIKIDKAISAAQKKIGDDSHVISAILGIEKGFLIYNVLVADKHDNIQRIIVDAGDGNVLSESKWGGGGGSFSGGGASGSW